MELEERFAQFDDITDPDAFCEVLIYYEELQAEDEEFMELLFARKGDMIVTWDQPWYQQSKTVTRALNDAGNNDLESYRTDFISQEESDKIRKNWKKFCKLFNLPDKPVCFARWRNTSKSKNPNTPEESVRRYVTAFLARGLKRTLKQVYKHFVACFGNVSKGYYSPCEEKILAICALHLQQKAVPYVSFILSREPRHIYLKVQQLSGESNKQKRPKLKWDLPLATKFLNHLMSHTGLSLENLKNKRLEKSVWLALQDDMDQKYIYLQKFWYSTLHPQLFVKSDIKIKKLRRKIFKRIRIYPYKVWSDIRWKEIQKHFRDGFTDIFLYTMCVYVARRMPNYRKEPLEDVISFCLQHITKQPSRRLRNLELNENQELVIRRYTNKDYLS